ncbi:MAG: hypothetical protein U5P10_14830 [Spirochaetia bacterium]|nr:hypothetical protein [Spirochaetia bacterium]
MKIGNFILCDDIRYEVGSKLSLMGVYADSIEFSVPPDKKDTWPKRIRLAVYLTADLEGKTSSAFKIRAVHEKGEVILGEGSFEQGIEDKLKIGMVNRNFAFETDGEYAFFLDVFDAEGKLIERSEPGFSVMVKERVVE